MENILKRAILKTDEKPHEVLSSIREVCQQMENVQLRFEMECDSDLIEACIYEMESLRARYRYLLRIAKGEGVKGNGMISARNTQAIDKIFQIK
jgi:hypothetical protein